MRYRTLFDSIDEGFAVIEMFFDKKDQTVDYAFLDVNPNFAEAFWITRRGWEAGAGTYSEF